MRADQNVDAAGRHALDDFFLLLWRSEARDHLDVDGELREALLEGFKMLEAEHGGGREHRDLLAVLHGFEGGAHGHFSLAVAHVAAEQPVHGRRRFHVVLDGADGRGLIVGFAVVESVLELALELVVFGECRAFRGVALGVELEQFAGHVLHGASARAPWFWSTAASPAC